MGLPLALCLAFVLVLFFVIRFSLAIGTSIPAFLPSPVTPAGQGSWLSAETTNPCVMFTFQETKSWERRKSPPLCYLSTVLCKSKEQKNSFVLLQSHGPTVAALWRWKCLCQSAKRPQEGSACARTRTFSRCWPDGEVGSVFGVLHHFL